METEQELNQRLANRNELGQFMVGHNVSESNRKALKESMVGKVGYKARHWKKGKYINSKGYVMVYAGTREGVNKSGYIPEHRLIAESHIGRKLTGEEVVHHINGIKDDNDPSNLWIYDRKEHRAIHNEEPFAIVARLYQLGEVRFQNGHYFINKTQ